MHAIAARFAYPANWKAWIKARDRSHPVLYGLSAERDCAGAVTELDVAPEPGTATQSRLPIGPCCC
jgi:hypothetical protein